MASPESLTGIYSKVIIRLHEASSISRPIVLLSQILHREFLTVICATSLYSACSVPFVVNFAVKCQISPYCCHRDLKYCSYPSGVGHARYFSADVVSMPAIQDPKLNIVFKDLMAASWDKLPEPVIYEAKTALSGSTDDKAGKEIVENVFRAAVAAEEFGDILINLKMEIDDSIGLSGENVKPLSDELKKALHTVHDRYIAYLDSFGPEENYLRKKVETELGTKMIYLKMRCSGLGSEWGKVSVLGTSGLSGSYVEQRA
ncbi:succinate dehydrogenase subunit 5 [Cucumis melo var. makuwa]|uniref:Succinate dehydrogenase subunit 5 n=1 Tax=Cucumis melo var. makuwa TaxID=1194695 RepID=A0A5A7V4R2_CUCMM|nr:succinate dehydrogenase subunit 5 [Cucumis melo var. makuwa]